MENRFESILIDSVGDSLYTTESIRSAKSIRIDSLSRISLANYRFGYRLPVNITYYTILYHTILLFYLQRITHTTLLC